MSAQHEIATLGAGCFWCVEAIFQDIQGVEKVVCGYAGGHVENPTYQQVCTGITEHAEAVRITFDPSVLSYAELLDIFWRIHDPTTLNRQGPDSGTQYRSVIFYHTEEQRQVAERSRQATDASDLWDDPIVTEITPFTSFYEAEGYHRNYFRRNPNQPYCRAVIDPKIRKFRKSFQERLKTV